MVFVWARAAGLEAPFPAGPFEVSMLSGYRRRGFFNGLRPLALTGWDGYRIFSRRTSIGWGTGSRHQNLPFLFDQ